MDDRYFINIKGQSGDFPKVGLGTANLGAKTAEAVCTALKNGCTLIDAALCYRNHKSFKSYLRQQNYPSVLACHSMFYLNTRTCLGMKCNISTSTLAHSELNFN